jgi:hypothetical protein
MHTLVRRVLQVTYNEYHFRRAMRIRRRVGLRRTEVRNLSPKMRVRTPGRRRATVGPLRGCSPAGGRAT